MLKLSKAKQNADQAWAFAHKLTQGMDTFANLGEVKVGSTPKTLVYKEDNLCLYRYTPPAGVKPAKMPPVLICYALVNRPYIVDLQPDKSLVAGLLAGGADVYLIDWGYPSAVDQQLTMEDYILGYMHRCVEQVCIASAGDKVNLLGVCQGGVFSLCYSALFPEQINRLVTMVTPVDFHTPDNLLTHMIKSIDIDQLVDTYGNIPGSLLNSTFLSLKPYLLNAQKYVDMVHLLDDEEKTRHFMRMEQWIFDSPDQAGETYRKFIKSFFQQNQLIKGEFELAGQTVDLRNITMPVFNIYATKDHLVPPDASACLAEYVGTKSYESLAFEGGHIGIYVSGRAQKTVPPAILEWLKKKI